VKGNRGDDGRRGRNVGGGYKYFSNTTSGWEISVNDNAPPDKRWRAVHEEFGTKFFDNHDEILEFTLMHMMERTKRLLGLAR
jgi:hypothetical protein